MPPSSSASASPACSFSATAGASCPASGGLFARSEIHHGPHGAAPRWLLSRSVEHRAPFQHSGHCWRTCMVAPTMSRPEQRDASTLRHDGRWSLTLALADAGAASNAYRNESCDQSDEYFLHWSSPFFTPRDPHFVPRCPVGRSLPSMRSLPPETVGQLRRGLCLWGHSVIASLPIAPLFRSKCNKQHRSAYRRH
jgi:hypothetical protein